MLFRSPAVFEIPGGRKLINPGSVGQPRDGDPRAAFAWLDTASATVEFRRIAYDIVRTQDRMRKLGLPAILADRLTVGL